ncbi:MAG: riboflavin kinase [bacterium]
MKIIGIVKKERGHGKEMGFPTINIEIDGKVIINDGIYAAEIFINNIKYLGAAYYGIPHEGKEKRLEVHIFDFNKDVYGQKVELLLHKKFRDSKSFSNRKEVTNAIKKDCENIKEYFNSSQKE